MLGYLLFIIVLLTAMFFSVQKNKLTPAGAINGGVIACFIFTGAGYTGMVMIGSFFLIGTLATSWQINIKEKLGAAEEEKGRRRAGQVIANGGVAGIAGLFCYFFPDQRALLRVMMAAALSSATADTLSSELGTLYGKRFYNIINFKNDKRGENGVVSLEGLLFGIAGSILIGTVYSTGFGWDVYFVWIVLAGTAGNISDSVLGATLERKRFLNNDAVNFFNTLIAAAAALLLVKLF